MDFASLPFLFIFLPLAIVVFLIAEGKFKPLILFVLSSIFYLTLGASSIYAVVGLIVANFLLGYGVDRLRSSRAGKVLLVVGIAANLCLLILSKLFIGYGSMAGVAQVARFIFPLGLSYLCFQAITYLVDIFKGGGNEKNILRFALYVLFFPKLLSGPIVPYRLFVVTKIGETVGIDVVKDGLRRFAFGLAKKVLIADHLGKTVNAAFELDVPNYPPFVAWLVLIGFALQLYFDFSGYMDMSLGLGRVFGVQLPENFNDPYTARSISEFWRRWHMTLSAWFREYVFYPLERQRLPILGQQFNILFVFLLTGLWHGLTPTFMVWGLIHGAAIVFEGTAIGKRLRLAWPPIQHFYALSVILFSWVFFRSNSLEFAGLFIRRLLGDTSGIQILPFSTTTPLPFIEPTFVVAMISGVIFAMPVANWLTAWKKRLVTHNPAFSFPLQIVWDGAALFLLWAAISALAGGAFSPGIYDKF